MGAVERLQAAFDKVLVEAGNQIRITTFTQTVGSVWDDEVTLTSPVEVWTSGITFPLKNREGSEDAVLLQQGRLIDNDLKLYVSGGVNLTGSDNSIRIGIGSPPSFEYAPVPLGVKVQSLAGTNIYKKAYIRQLTGSTLIGE